jgi:hypothetical protein
MKETTPIDEKQINAAPLKSFFVSMLTRDIDLEDSILDLLDNCVDGILRSRPDEGNQPYYGYKAEIRLEKDLFLISDNCGGIPWNLHKYAFRMGRDPERQSDAPGLVGYYGIGMKRAIFKMGRNCSISTKNINHQYQVEITQDWLQDEYTWDLPVKNINWKGKDGTIIKITNLYSNISKQFEENSKKFTANLERIISTHYAIIIEKGFEIKINNQIVVPRTTKLVFDSHQLEQTGIRPFIFKTITSDNVDVFLAVGFWRPPPSENEINEEKESTKYSSMDAGWTIVCNDRVVVFCDRSELTGWGEAGVPRFHNQFIAISGVVEFRSKDPGKLPTKTTKRGLDSSAPIYLQVKNKMREGMKIFTDYTNKWKGREDESKKQISKGENLPLREIRQKSEKLSMNTTSRTVIPGEQYRPNLPKPELPESTARRISFVKENIKIKKVAAYFGDSSLDPSDVGEKCFDLVYQEAK